MGSAGNLNQGVNSVCISNNNPLNQLGNTTLSERCPNDDIYNCARTCSIDTIMNWLVCRTLLVIIIRWDYCCIIIIIFITSHHHHEYSWPSLATPPYCSLLPVGLQGYILYRHRAAVCRFVLVVLPLLVHVKGSTGVHHLWARPDFSSGVPHILLV